MSKSNKQDSNEALVLQALRKYKAPLGAYELLDQLRSSGIKAPPQIYRALERLVKQGVVHRLESLNAFIACNQDLSSGENHTCTFTICSDCKSVAELSDRSMERQLKRLERTQNFNISSATIELHGHCNSCKSV